jgi:hypothetical protein
MLTATEWETVKRELDSRPGTVFVRCRYDRGIA